MKKQIDEFIQDLDDERASALYRKIPSGKMLRSKLILQIASGEAAIYLAAIVEMIHAASLLHDDVIDESERRRGEASINVIAGNRSAIMLGDIFYSKAFYELTTLKKPIPRIISNAVTLLSQGELMDVELSKQFNPDMGLYMDMIYKKTASLIEASAMSAAALEGKDIEKYALYGKNLGLAFQIVDDILDITQDEQTLGKPAMHDFKEGKSTLPYIYLFQRLDRAGRAKLFELFGKEMDEKQRSWLKEAFEQTGALDAAKVHAHKLGKEALEVLDREDEKLQEIMQSLIDRTY